MLTVLKFCKKPMACWSIKVIKEQLNNKCQFTRKIYPDFRSFTNIIAVVLYSIRVVGLPKGLILSVVLFSVLSTN